MRAILLLTGLLLTSVASATPLQVGNLEDYTPATESNCGVFLANRSGDLTFFGDTHYKGFIKLEGKVVELNHVHTTNQQKGTGVVTSGDRYTATYGRADVQVHLRMKVTKGCESFGRKCEQVDESGEMIVSKGKDKSTLRVGGVEVCPLEED